MNEKNIQTLFSKWMQTEGIQVFDSVAVELKLVKGKSFAFNRMPDHQIEALKQVAGKGHHYKIQDMAAISGYANPKPYDCYTLKGEAFIGICFYVPRKRKTLYLIKVQDFIGMKINADRKSATESMCIIASERVIDL